MKKYLFALAILLSHTILFAQQGFVAAGGDAKTAGGSVSFSAGQVNYHYFGDGGNLVIEGLQQPLEISHVLPVSLLYFSAKGTNENTVALTWSTTSESNNDYFTIERSKDGTLFEKVGTVPSKGNSSSTQNYAFTDAGPYPGVSFYRLQQTDKDGKFTYSEIQQVTLSGSSFTATAFPNPTRDVVQLKISGVLNSKMNYLLIDMTGRVLLKGMISNAVTPINLGNLSAGTYILKVINDGKELQSFKILKTN